MREYRAMRCLQLQWQKYYYGLDWNSRVTYQAPLAPCVMRWNGICMSGGDPEAGLEVLPAARPVVAGEVEVGAHAVAGQSVWDKSG